MSTTGSTATPRWTNRGPSWSWRPARAKPPSRRCSTNSTPPRLSPRQCSALLTRQALDAALDEFWEQQRAPGVKSGSRHSQLLCLGSYVGDDQLSARVAHTWAALSNACHYHSYELVPTAGELEGWIETVDAFAGSCEALLD